MMNRDRQLRLSKLGLGLVCVFLAFSTSCIGAASAPAQSLPIPVSVVPLSITTLSLPSGSVGTSYAQALSASGGTPPYTWSLVSGSLPAGLTLSGSGMIAGTPTSAGQFSLKVQVADSSSPQQIDAQAFSISLSPTCVAPNYCGYTGTDVKPYPSGPVPTPPARNTSFTDPVFNRKIWRWTDGTTAPNTDQRAQGIGWHAGSYPGAWNSASNALIVNDDQGWSNILKVDSSNPNAPVVSKLSCSGSALCSAGQVHMASGPIFANGTSTPFLVFYADPFTNPGAICKVDLAANFNTTNQPVGSITCPWFDPYASGHCASGVSRPSGGIGGFTTSDDQYFWGVGSGPNADKMILWHVGDSNCTLFDIATGTISGGGQQGGGTGTLTWTYEDGSPAPAPSCTNYPISHGQWYDQVTNTLVVQPNPNTCSPPYNYGNTAIRVNLSTLHAHFCDSITHPGCGSGHGFGLNFHVGGQAYDTSFATVGAPLDATNTSSLWATPLTLPDTREKWGNYSQVPDSHYPASHAASLWSNGQLPVIAVDYSQDLDENTSPPQPTLPTGFTIPYAEEIVGWVINDLSGSNFTRYRFVHTYEADRDFNSGGLYPSAVGPALSPDRCWVAYPSNWYGNLGTIGNRGTACTASNRCAYDVFAVYICGS